MAFRALSALILAGCLAACGCASAGPKKEAQQRKEKELAAGRALKKAFERGRSAPEQAVFVKELEEASLAYILYKSSSPFAGARRLLDFKERHPSHPLLEDLALDGGEGAFDELQEDEAFRGGQFFNSFDPALYVPFFRQTLLQYLRQEAWDDEGFRRLTRTLILAAQLTPRFAGVYPNQLSPEVRSAMQAYLADYPTGPSADRLRMLLLWDERNGAWTARRQAIDAELSALRSATEDELLKLELKDALDAPLIKPERGFWMSLLVPGLGQVAGGDLQGGLLLGGLTLSAWAWMLSKVAAAQTAPDADTRRVYEGDAALAGGLAVLGHLFTAFNASEQAHFVNIVLEWDILSKDRLNP